eukprot:jgi/Picsp_1/6256/NSC_03610-R1_squamosa promoter binding protein
MVEDMGQEIVEYKEKVTIPSVTQAVGQVRVETGPLYKRGRGRSFFKNGPRKGHSCQVPGCSQPIHSLREYYKRYKICAHHMELSCLKVDGQYIRFCQQCGRFQLLSEFDGEKRSCRSKLAKHNLRRRQGEAGSLSCEREESLGQSESKRPRSEKLVSGIRQTRKVVEEQNGFHSETQKLPELSANMDKGHDVSNSLRMNISEPEKDSLVGINKSMMSRQEQEYNNISGSLQGTLLKAQNTRPSIQSARSAFHAPLQTRVPSAKIPKTAMFSVAQSYSEPSRNNNLYPNLSNTASEGVGFPDYRLLELILRARRLYSATG